MVGLLLRTINRIRMRIDHTIRTMVKEGGGRAKYGVSILLRRQKSSTGIAPNSPDAGESTYFRLSRKSFDLKC